MDDRLEDIKAWALGHNRRMLNPEDAAWLIAEVERLRAEASATGNDDLAFCLYRGQGLERAAMLAERNGPKLAAAIRKEIPALPI